MDVLYDKQCPELGCTIEVGAATWDRKKDVPPEESAVSVRARYENANGGFYEKSPEMEIKALCEGVTFAIEAGAIQTISEDGVLKLVPTDEWWAREHGLVPAVATA